MLCRPYRVQCFQGRADDKQPCPSTSIISLPTRLHTSYHIEYFFWGLYPSARKLWPTEGWLFGHNLYLSGWVFSPIPFSSYNWVEQGCFPVAEDPHATADLPFEKPLFNTRTIPASTYFDHSEGKFGKHESPQFAKICCDCASRKNCVFRFLAMHTRYMG